MAGDTAVTVDQILVSRFWSKVEMRGPGECWHWLAGRHSNGYGVSYDVNVRRTQLLAHRAALMLSTGESPEGLHALHSCDNPPCCNPAHLRWGTPADNAIDKMLRGRAKAGRARVDACPKGHRMDEPNTMLGMRAGKHGRIYETRSCRECNRLYLERRRAARKEQHHGR